MNLDVLYKTFFEKFEFLLDTLAPVKKNSKNKSKFKDKPWIPFCLQKSTSIKNLYLSKFVISKDTDKKEEA